MQRISLDECLNEIADKEVTVHMHFGSVSLTQQEKEIAEIRNHGDLVHLLFDDDELLLIERAYIKEVTVEDDEYTVVLDNGRIIIEI